MLYSNGCPKCEILKLKLDAKNVNYITSDDIVTLRNNKIFSLPQLQLEDGTFLDYRSAVAWSNDL